MIKETVLGIYALATMALPVPTPGILLSEKTLDLTQRNPSAYINEIFSDNILLSLHYLKGDIGDPQIDWTKVRESFGVSFVLEPGATFAFHGSAVLPEFENPTLTMNTFYMGNEGYKAFAGLYGNGVCHLATLINQAAAEAGLEVVAKVNHDFAPVPLMPREYGTSIRTFDKNQNLYLRNDFDYPVTFEFQADKEIIALKIIK